MMRNNNTAPFPILSRVIPKGLRWRWLWWWATHPGFPYAVIWPKSGGAPTLLAGEKEEETYIPTSCAYVLIAPDPA